MPNGKFTENEKKAGNLKISTSNNGNCISFKIVLLTSLYKLLLLRKDLLHQKKSNRTFLFAEISIESISPLAGAAITNKMDDKE